ncbi:uncharacterized protein UV8b_06005 [Ustilaginoidea virens]|uniref:CN hydrolase domain-containing protein n=1 Tax=Ustilaginoidea virens TaxID=1159556 RepID=A0A8E5HUJ6_USTVR|nr:uncharacterized protein UV8b_06005 [Ustilaginoidea virens]QUC21762.1 hypothetical protein UV8b_06005 [Ustilaginoidea virens]
MPTIRVGTASPATSPTRSATLNRLAHLAHRAASESIDVFLLPEAFIGGYPHGSTFGCVVGERTVQGREEFAKYFDGAVDLGDIVGGGAGAGDRWVKRELPGLGDANLRGDGTREELEKIANETGVFIVTGLVEKAGGSLYCSVVYVCPKEGMVGKRRKVMPTAAERLIWAQGSPSTLRAISTTIRGTRVNLAAAICWENYMPVVRQALYSQNINLYLAPTADDRDAWLSLMRTIGIEGRCFALTSNMAVKRDGPAVQTSPSLPRARRGSIITDEGFQIALPASPTKQKRRKSVFDEDGNEIVLCCDAENGDAKPVNGQKKVSVLSDAKRAGSGWVRRGGSCIVNPYGDVIAGPQWEDDEGIIYADIDLRDCIRGRLDMDTAGSYSRNDSFKFSVEGLDLDPLPYQYRDGEQP